MQRCEGCVAFHLFDQGRGDSLVVLHRRATGNHTVTDRRRGWEVLGMQRVSHLFEGNSPGRQGWSLIDHFLAFGILDPELALIGSDAVGRALVEFLRFAVAGPIHRELDRRRTAIQNQYRQRRHENDLSV